MALGSTQPLNRNEYQDYFLGGEGGRCVRLTTYHHPVPLSRNLGALTSWNPLGHFGPVMGLLYFTFYPLYKRLVAPRPLAVFEATVAVPVGDAGSDVWSRQL